MDRTDARILLALVAHPRATVVQLAGQVGLSRNTVQARLARYDEQELLASFERRIEPAAVGYPLTAFMTVTLTQQMLDDVAVDLSAIPEVLEVFGISGAADLLVRVAARDADDLYRIAGQVLGTRGVVRTETALLMRRMVDYRVGPLLERAFGCPEPAQSRRRQLIRPPQSLTFRTSRAAYIGDYVSCP